MKRTFLTILFSGLLSLAVAQPGNYTGYSDTSAYGFLREITKFKADSLRYSNPVWLGNTENKIVVCMVADTNGGGRVTDSIKMVYGYQRGVIVKNSAGKCDTSWRTLIVLDTISTQPGDTAGHWLSSVKFTTTDMTTGQETWVSRYMDSSYVSGYIVASTPITPCYAPLARFWVKGIASNGNRRSGGFFLVRMIMQSRLYVNTHGM
jgi:hypothetical protein